MNERQTQKFWWYWKALEVSKSRPGPKYCAECGAENAPDATYCGACGKLLGGG